MADEPRPAGEEPEYHLHTELGHELVRLGRHPVKESERLAQEARDGDVDTTPGILIGGILFWVGIFAAIVIGVTFLAAYLATR
jgi:hypothetical protein